MVPLAKRISDENLLRYNGMLIGVFELLADTRTQIATVNAAIGAQRDFWLANADLDMAMVGKPNPPHSPRRAAPRAHRKPAADIDEAHVMTSRRQFCWCRHCCRCGDGGRGEPWRCRTA